MAQLDTSLASGFCSGERCPWPGRRDGEVIGFESCLGESKWKGEWKGEWVSGSGDRVEGGSVL